MTVRFLLLALPLLAACAAEPRPPVSAPAAEPRAVTLYRDTVTARMADGSLCAAVREGASGPWSASFRGCPHPWPVRVARTADVPRLPLAPTQGDAWVTLAAPGGPLAYAPRP